FMPTANSPLAHARRFALRRPLPGRDRQGAVTRKGGALLAVLWMSAALAAIGFSVATTIRTETGHASTAADGLRAQFLATGSVERAIQWMTWGAQPRTPQVPFWDPTMPRLNMSYPSGDAVVEMIPE